MLRRLVLFVGVLWSVACGGDSTGPNAGPDRYVGTWRLDIAQAAGCWPAFTVFFSIDQDDADRGSGGVMNVVSEWWFGSSPSSRHLMSGNVDWGRNSFTIVLSRITSSIRRGRFEGADPTATKLTGTFTDFDRAFVTGLSCTNPQASANATKQ